MSFAWGYSESNGPAVWGKHFPPANGSKQTPIDIDPSAAKFCADLKPIECKYCPKECTKVNNTGASFKVDVGGGQSVVTGATLPNPYRLEQFHFHWGQTSKTGSEHRINGKMFAAELHLVHWNADKFASFGEAAQAEDGLCVLGIFLDIGDADHPGLEPLCQKMATVPYKDDAAPLADGFDPTTLLPGNVKRYWHYGGSLTTPPCFESVYWVVFEQPIKVSERQMAAFRSLYSNTKASGDLSHVMENYRPPLALNGRQVLASFN